MTPPPAAPVDLPGTRRFLPFLLLLFVGSGCAALIYEIVWLQWLQLVIGSTAVSLGVLLGTFMGGMCLGSLLLSRLVSSRRHPLRVYAMLELAIGGIGLLVLFGMPVVESLYTSFGHGFMGILMRGVVSGVCLLPPTLLMGATLPAIARWVETTREGVSWLGFFYGGNIAGAVCGCLLAGFYLLRVHDMAVATYAAVGLNIVVAMIAFWLSGLTPHKVVPAPTPAATTTVELAPGARMVYVTIAISGMAALGSEVVWTRLISLLLGGTVYTFSLILAVFLIGLGLGSGIGAMLARAVKSPRVALGICQLLLVAGIAWTAYMVTSSIPYWPINPELSNSPWFTLQLDMVRCLWALLPAACLWGASFPLALAAVAARGQDAGRLVGGVYAANTLGAIFGSLAFALVLIPWLGTQNAQRVLMGMSIVGALVALGPVLWSMIREARTGREASALWPRFAALAAALVAAGWFVWSVPPMPWGVVAFGRHFTTWIPDLAPEIMPESEVPGGSGKPDRYCVYVGEGMNVSVAVTKSREGGWRYFHGAGKVQASSDPQDMRLQRLLGHISALGHPGPESVLVVACGAGVTAGSFLPHPTVKRVVICDIEPLVPTTVTPMFNEENYHIVDGIKKQNPHTVNGKQVEVIYDDGRHFVRTTQEKFDVITSDPIDPWVKGCAALNTVEYYTMCKERLKPGGVMTLWIPLYESNNETVKSVIGTFFKVFPNGILWSNDINGEGYDAVLFGRAEPTPINVDALQARLDRDDHKLVKQSLAHVGFNTAAEMLATYSGRAVDLQKWMADAQINTDRNLRLQYLAGFWLNSAMSSEILNGIHEYYKFPDDMLLGSQESIRELKELLAKGGRARNPRITP